MIRECAFDPQSGAPLGEERHYPASWTVGARSPEYHETAAWTDSREGALTNGELVSTKQGLLAYFKRTYRAVHGDPDAKVERAAALAFHRLKATQDTALDSFVWYATAERLARKGIWSVWMLDHANPRCPLCRSGVRFREAVWSLEAICVAEPHQHGCVDEAIHDRVADLYGQAFSERIETVCVLTPARK